MNYKFEISQPDHSEFRCEMAIDAEQTFQQLHDLMVETFGLDASQMASFFEIDRMGNRCREIALMEMSLGDEEGGAATLVMEGTKINEIVNAHCLELEYVYDFFSDGYLKVEYAGEYVGDSSAVMPLCLLCEGPLPKQTSYDPEEDWAYDEDPEEGAYDESFMDEFGGGDSSYGGGGRRRGGDDDDFGFGDEEDEYADDDYSDGFNDRFESLDDYIDKL